MHSGSSRSASAKSSRSSPRSAAIRSEEHTSELQSLRHLVCRLLLEKKKISPTHATKAPHQPNLHKSCRLAVPGTQIDAYDKKTQASRKNTTGRPSSATRNAVELLCV